MSVKEDAKVKIASLIEKYEGLKAAGKLKEYNEANTRKDFIMPLFEALGWDTRDKAEISEEETVSNGAVDYAFRINGLAKYYLEAKKFSIDLEEEQWAAQAINYAWYKSVCWAVLSDFEGIKVFNAEWRERHISKNIFLDLKYSDYLSRFDDLWLLSKEGVSTGLLDQKAEQYGRKEKRRPVNEAVFDDLLAWRKLLLDDLNKLKQPLELTEEEKEEVVQKILDRFIFIRSCEDRGIEEQRLRAALRSWEESGEAGNLYEDVLEVYKQYYLYDNNLFIPNHPCEKVSLYNNSIKIIINGLYYNHSEKIPYDFKNIPADILGGIYEQYLGYILKKGKLVAGRPHRKEKGIYYTPKYVVDYIVENTLDKLLQDLPREKAGQIKILDPACGSGSFLIKALEVMDKYYEQDPKDKNFPFVRRVKALQNNIYGVDLDEKAVEIAQLNLMMRALADRRALPDVSRNIKCGNSLISGTPEDLKKLFGANWLDKRPFNWEEQFSDVFKQGGFDVIIGNPPYIKEDTDKSAFDGLHNSPYYQGKMDIWTLFACKAIDLLKNGGYFSFIAPSSWIASAGASIFRKKLLQSGEIIKYIDFSDYKVFKDASIQTMIFIFQKKTPRASYQTHYVKIVDKDAPVEQVALSLASGFIGPTETAIVYEALIRPLETEAAIVSFSSNANSTILSILDRASNYKLSKNDVGNGIDVLQDFVTERHLPKLKDKTISKGDGIFVLDNSFADKLSLNEKERGYLKPYYTPKQINRYLSLRDSEYKIIYADKYFREHINQFPNLRAHIDRFKNVLTSAFAPYGLHRPREEYFFAGKAVFLLRKTMRPAFTYVEFPCYVTRAFLILKPSTIDLKYLTGLLNSNLLYFWLKNMGKRQGEQLQIDKEPLLRAPLLKPTTEKQELIARCVGKLIALNDQLHKIPENTNKWSQLKEEIAKTDKQIDDLVYKLYGLTEGEIKVVEGA